MRTTNFGAKSASAIRSEDAFSPLAVVQQPALTEWADDLPRFAKRCSYHACRLSMSSGTSISFLRVAGPVVCEQHRSLGEFKR